MFGEDFINKHTEATLEDTNQLLAKKNRKARLEFAKNYGELFVFFCRQFEGQVCLADYQNGYNVEAKTRLLDTFQMRPG